MNSVNFVTSVAELYEPEEKNNSNPPMASSIVKTNPYITNIIKNSKLHVVHDKNVIEQPSRLFHLFLPIYVFYNKIRNRTNQISEFLFDPRIIFLIMRYLL